MSNPTKVSLLALATKVVLINCPLAIALTAVSEPLNVNLVAVAGELVPMEVSPSK